MISRTCFIHWPFLYIYIYMVLWYNSTIIWFLVLISHIKQQSYAILSIKLQSYDYEYIFIYIQKNIIVGKNFKNTFTEWISYMNPQLYCWGRKKYWPCNMGLYDIIPQLYDFKDLLHSLAFSIYIHGFMI